MDRENLFDYAVVIHGLKGSSRGIYANPVGDFAEQLEKAAKSGDFEFVQNNNKDFIELVSTLIGDIKAFFVSLDEARPKPIKAKLEKESMERLSVACDTYDMDSVDELMAEITSYQYVEDDDLVGWLVENARQTNFPEIVEKLSSLVF